MTADHSVAVVIDISSDEEEEQQVLGLGGWWEEETDEVVVLDALSAPSVKRLKQSGEFVGGGLVDDDDDDCLVLESDPDKPVLVESDQGKGGDDLLIVAEKGQLACRDYPHPRHLCANFPFSSSLHEKYCELCHCYVCDSPAPCNYWANGDLTTDHCNSTDKEPSWRALRKSFKLRTMAATHPQIYKDNSSSRFLPFRGRAPVHSNSNPILASLSQSNLLQPCSKTPITKTNLINRGRFLPATLPCHNQRYNFMPKGQPLQRETGLTYSRKRSRKDGALEAHFTTLNSPYSTGITVSANHHNPDTVPVTSQSPRWSEVGQRASQTPLIVSSSDSTGIMQAAVSSQFVPSATEGPLCSLITAADVNLKTWQDVMAHAASESGIPEFHSSQK